MRPDNVLATLAQQPTAEPLGAGRSFAKDCAMIHKQAPAEITVHRSPTRVAYIDASLPAALAELLWQRPQALVALGKPLQRVRKRRTVRVQWDSQRFAFKHYGEASRLSGLKRSVRKSRAYSTWVASHRLVEAGIRTPRPVACVENRWGPMRRDSFLMYPYVDGKTLRSYFAGELEDVDTEHLHRQLRELWQKLRESRISLTDTQLRNFIVCPAGRVWVIDLDRTRFHRSNFVAAHYQERGWKRLLRSVATAERQAARTVSSLLGVGGITWSALI
jgi:hypothetical protein